MGWIGKRTNLLAKKYQDNNLCMNEHLQRLLCFKEQNQLLLSIVWRVYFSGYFKNTKQIKWAYLHRNRKNARKVAL